MAGEEAMECRALWIVVDSVVWYRLLWIVVGMVWLGRARPARLSGQWRNDTNSTIHRDIRIRNMRHLPTPGLHRCLNSTATCLHLAFATLSSNQPDCEFHNTLFCSTSNIRWFCSHIFPIRQFCSQTFLFYNTIISYEHMSEQLWASRETNIITK